jgi:hypothetical protein
VLDHLRGPVGGQHLSAKPCGRKAQATGPSGDVEECVGRLQSGEPKSGRCQVSVAGSDMLVVKSSDRIPRLDGRAVLAVLRYLLLQIYNLRLLSANSSGGEKR